MNIVNMTYDFRDREAAAESLRLCRALDSVLVSDSYDVIGGCKDNLKDNPRALIYEHKELGVRAKTTISSSGMESTLRADILEEHGSAEDRQKIVSEIRMAIASQK